MNREEIKQIIPHREPMLLVDEIVLDGEYARATYTVRGDEWFLQGHFPNNPVVPGVVLCEIIAQGASLLLRDDLIGKVPFFCRHEQGEVPPSRASGRPAGYHRTHHPS